MTTPPTPPLHRCSPLARLAPHALAWTLAAAAFAVVSLGCSGTLEVGVDRTPTPDLRATATIAALTRENERLSALLSASASATPAPVSAGRVAYVQGSDIWHRPLPDGRAQRLTTDGRNAEPRWSPSGYWVAYRKETQVYVRSEVLCDIPTPRKELCFEWTTSNQRQLWVVDVAGNDEYQLSHDLTIDSFAWSPTRDRLAFLSAEGLLVAVNPDGAARTVLFGAADAAHPAARADRFLWSPDGLWLAVEWSNRPGQSTAQGIDLVSQDGRGRATLANGGPPGGIAILAAWSAASDSVLFWRDPQRIAYPSDGAPVLRASVAAALSGAPTADVALDRPVLPLPGFVVPAPAAAIPGSRDAVAVVTGTGQSTWSAKQVSALGFRSPEGLAALWPAWSPDGSRLAYSAMPEARDVDPGDPALQSLLLRRIWIADLAGGSPPRRLTVTVGYRDERPQWSADGSQILFARLDARGRASLWLVPAGEGTARQVVEELTPAPNALGAFGYVRWEALYDWWTVAGR